MSVEVTAYRPVFVLGEVSRPGQYPYQPGMTVQTAVAVAGGFTYRAVEDAFAITRNVAGQDHQGPRRAGDHGAAGRRDQRLRAVVLIRPPAKTGGVRSRNRERTPTSGAAANDIMLPAREAASIPGVSAEYREEIKELQVALAIRRRAGCET